MNSVGVTRVQTYILRRYWSVTQAARCSWRESDHSFSEAFLQVARSIIWFSNLCQNFGTQIGQTGHELPKNLAPNILSLQLEMSQAGQEGHLLGGHRGSLILTVQRVKRVLSFYKSPIKTLLGDEFPGDAFPPPPHFHQQIPLTDINRWRKKFAPATVLLLQGGSPLRPGKLQTSNHRRLPPKPCRVSQLSASSPQPSTVFPRQVLLEQRWANSRDPNLLLQRTTVSVFGPTSFLPLFLPVPWV